MNEILFFIVAFVVGLVLGILFFGGLWITVKKTATAKMPAIWILSSFFIRVGIVLIGFYFVAQGNWQRIIICLIGFIIARFIVTYFTKSRNTNNKKDIYHET